MDKVLLGLNCLKTKLFGKTFIGIWHTKLTFIFSKVVTCHLNKGATAKMV